MSTIALQGVHLSVYESVGATTYLRGVGLARAHRVSAAWVPGGRVLHGMVRSSRGAGHTATVHFGLVGGAQEFEHGICSCAARFDCEHVVAVIVAALGAGQAARATDPRPAPPAWETSLDSLFAEPAPRTLGRAAATPLAIELSLAPDARSPQSLGTATPMPRLLARLVKWGNKGWVRGTLSWSALSGSPHRFEGHPPEHTRLLRELYAIHQAQSGRSYPYSSYYYGDEKTIDLATMEPRRLWPLLDEAAAIELRLVHAKKRLGPVEDYVCAELYLDATRPDPSGPLSVAPVIRAADDAVAGTPIRFIGGTGLGVVLAEAPAGTMATDLADVRIRLARLGRPVPAELQRMALEGGALAIPAAELARFRDEFCPRLRRLAPVVSSDGSFAPPEISGPTLVLNAAYGSDHDLALSWEWAYDVGGSRVCLPLESSAPDTGYRDPEQERAVLTGLGIPSDWSAQLGASAQEYGDEALPLAPRAAVQGLDTMRFTTELLPLLRDHPDLAVEISGVPADYREAGESLCIAVSTDEVAGSTDWFDLGVTLTVEGREVSFAEVFVALNRGETHMLLDDGAYFSLQKPQLQALQTLIEEARALQDAPGGSLRISRFQTGLWDELVELGVVERQATAWQRQVDGLRAIGSVGAAEPPATLTARLRPYQLDGFRWLAFLWEFQLGGILADDMGLGKTLQTLALIAHAKQLDPDVAPFLIVAPTSVVSNWAAEAARFAPGLRVAAITDTMRRRGGTLDEVVSGADIVVTTYTLFRLDIDAYSALPWGGLVLDEAQFAKNHQSKIYQCARELPAPVKLAISGTPMENNLMELWSLLSITAPGLFPSPTRFRDYYARPIEGRGDADLLAQLRRRVKPLIKRRTKEQVAADLPAKQEQILEVELHPRHRKVYETHLQRERQKVLGLVDDMNKNRFTIFRSLTLLRQLSLHAGLVDDAHLDLPCAKIDALLEQLTDVVDGGHRALVFSQFTGFLAQVRERLEAAGLEYCYLDGSTRNRPAVLDRFKTGTAPVFLISLKAGGCGLNLTEADYCFLLDPWWNPATEEQAVDRTHRIGQTRNVMVYRLIAKDTIEEKVMALKARKAELFAGVMDDGNAFGTSLSAEDVRGLFS